MPGQTNFATIWQYDARGLLVNATETFMAAGGLSSNAVNHSFDAYGQLGGESVKLGGTVFSSASQKWDVAGRRSSLSVAGATYGFSWRADGTMVVVNGPAGPASYVYDNAGVLVSRSLGGRTATITSRDGIGRPLSLATDIGGTAVLDETLTWTSDGRLATHAVEHSLFGWTDWRSYAYAGLSRRLVEEQVNLDANKRWTNSRPSHTLASISSPVCRAHSVTAVGTFWRMP